jgi:hypothetical protein
MTLRPPSLPPLEGPAWREYALLALLLATVFFASYKPLADPDAFWHLAVGREIWTTGHLVRSETFSFSAPGAPWEDTEWLFHAALFPLWRALGFGGLSALMAAAAALAVGLCYRSTRLMGGNAAALALWVTALMPALQTRVSLRPDVLSLSFTMILAEGLLRWDPMAGERDRFWAFSAVLFLAWCQVHGGWSYGFALLGVSAAGVFVDALRDGTLSRRLVARLAAAGLAPAATVFLNPYGWRTPWFPVKHVLSFGDPTMPAIAEWQRVPWGWATAPFIALVLIAAILQFPPVRNRSWRGILWCASQAAMGLYWARYAGFAALTLAPFGTRDLARVLRLPVLRRVGWVLALCALLATAWVYGRRPSAAEAFAKFPVQEARYLVDRGVKGRTLHPYAVGGFLEWVAPHRLLTLNDGRYFPFIQASKDERASTRSVASFTEFLQKYAIDIAIYPYQSFRLKGEEGNAGIPPRGPSALLFPSDRWALVHFGDYGMVFLRRTPSYETLIQRDEYQTLRPDDLAYEVWAAKLGRISSANLAADLNRKLAADGGGILRPQLELALKTLGAKASPPR